MGPRRCNIGTGQPAGQAIWDFFRISRNFTPLEDCIMAHKKIERKKEMDRRRKRRAERIKERIKEAKAAAKK